MRYERTPRLSAAVDTDALVIHMRTGFGVPDTDPVVLAECQRLADVAAMEVEAYCEISLTTQTITAWTQAEGGTVISLPVGPLNLAGSVTVNGSPFTGTIEGGRYPRLTLPDDTSGAIEISYQAGYGDTPNDIPADLQLAVMDQAGRMYDLRGAGEGAQGLSLSAARICARYRKVAV